MEYKLTDHLGSIRMTYKLNYTCGAVYQNANIQYMADYYSFGKIVREYINPGTAAEKYQYTGKERDTESGYDYFNARNYHSEVGRFLSVDALAGKYPYWSPYNYTMNNPIRFIDPDGRYILPAALAQQYSKLAGYLENGIGALLNQKDVRSGLKIIGNFNENQINQLSRYGEGISIDIKRLVNDAEHGTNGEINGYTPGNGSIQIDATLAQQLQNADSPEAEAAALLGIVSTILHETTHVGYNTNSVPFNRTSRDISDGNFSRTYNPKNDNYTYFYSGNEVGNSNETGRAFENAVWYNGGQNKNFGLDMKQGATGMQNQPNLYFMNLFTGNKDKLPKPNKE